MRLNKSQGLFVAGSVILVFILFFGFDTVPSRQKLVEKSRALSFESADIFQMINEAKDALGPEEAAFIRTLENIAQNAPTDSQRVETLKRLSGAWFDARQYIAAGHYAETVAETEGTEESWAIAGATYGAALTENGATDKQKDVALVRAVECYQNALSINPDNISHRINLAICYAEHPPQDSPMKGIQDLLALNAEYPENTSVLYHLARYGMQTGQYEKAVERLKTAIRVAPGESRLHCLLVEAYSGLGMAAEAEEHAELCNADMNSKN